MPKGGCGCNWFGRLTCTVRVKAVSRTMCSSGNVGRVMFGLDGGRDSCIHAGNDCIVTKAGVNAENVFHNRAHLPLFMLYLYSIAACSLLYSPRKVGVEQLKIIPSTNACFFPFYLKSRHLL